MYVDYDTGKIKELREQFEPWLEPNRVDLREDTPKYIREIRDRYDEYLKSLMEGVM